MLVTGFCVTIAEHALYVKRAKVLLEKGGNLRVMGTHLAYLHCKVAVAVMEALECFHDVLLCNVPGESKNQVKWPYMPGTNQRLSFRHLLSVVVMKSFCTWFAEKHIETCKTFDVI